MSFTTPTVDVYVPGTTLGLGNVNASTINIGQAGTTVNVGGTMAVTNAVTAPSCTMSSLTTGNLIISPFSGNAAFTNFSAVNASINNASIINASFNSLNSSNILIGPYPISGTYTNMNVTNASITNASITTLNVSGFLINPLPSDPTFTSINTPSIDVNANGTLTLGNQNATAIYIGSSGSRNVTNNIGTGSGTGTINIGNNTNSITLGGSTTLSKPLILGTAPTSNTQLGYIEANAAAQISGASSGYTNLYTFPSLPIGNYILNGTCFVNNNNWSAALGFSATSATQDTGFLTYSSGIAASFMNLTVLWKQTTVTPIYLISSGGTWTYQFIKGSYVRLG